MAIDSGLPIVVRGGLWGRDYFKYFRQRGAIIRGRRLIEWRLLFEEIRYFNSTLFNLPNVGDFFWSWIPKGTEYLSSQKEKENRCLVSTSSIKREISKIHFLFVKWQQKKKEKKSMMHVQSCFAILNQLLFCRSRCRCLNSVINLRSAPTWERQTLYGNISNKTLRSVHFDVVVVELINCKCGGIVRNQIW